MSEQPTKPEQEYTPITGKPIGQVSSDQWNSLSPTELWEQRSIIDQRLNYALQIGHQTMIEQLKIALIVLDQIIESKSSSTDNKLI